MAGLRPMAASMTDLHAEALATFTRLFDEALDAGEPDRTAMTVASASLDARPSARTVLLKAFDARGFVFYTPLYCRKGRELQANPHAALLFHWPRVRQGVQVRIEGEIDIVSDVEADAYFASRPRASQLGAWASDQSETLASREAFERRLAALLPAGLAGTEMQNAGTAGGLTPAEVQPFEQADRIPERPELAEVRRRQVDEDDVGRRGRA